MIEKWLEREVGQGLMGLVALRLDGAPAADAITLTLDIWLVALGKGSKWEESVDALRIRKAFETLYATCERWPAPARLMRELRPAEPQRQLARPKRTEEQLQTGNEALSQLIATMRRQASSDAALKTDEQIEDSKKQALAALAELQNRASQTKNMEQPNQ